MEVFEGLKIVRDKRQIPVVLGGLPKGKRRLGGGWMNVIEIAPRGICEREVAEVMRR